MYITEGLRPAERIMGAFLLSAQGGVDMRAHSPYPYADHLRVKRHKHNHTAHARGAARFLRGRFYSRPSQAKGV